MVAKKTAHKIKKKRKPLAETRLPHILKGYKVQIVAN